MEAKLDHIKGMEVRKECVHTENGMVQLAGCTEFEAGEILVVRTVGKPDEWEVMARVDLGSSLEHHDL